MAFNRKTHLRENIDAIHLALRLERENRQATDQERETLSRYSGFGGIKAILNPCGGEDDRQSWTKSDLELYPLIEEFHWVLRRFATDEKQYKIYVRSLKNSVLTAFYTPPPIIEALAQALRDAGVTPARLLEPSAGTGAFLLPFREVAPECAFTCFEKDLLTGKILSRLFPQDKVRIEGYEKIEEKYTGYFDVAASNIPFGDVAVFDPLFSNHKIPAVRQAAKAVHNYFFVKSVQTVREGGIIAFITSQGVLNSESNRPVREFLMQYCRVVSAVRLPNNLFTDYAGTEVGSDLIVLQKRTTGGELSGRQRDFIESRRLPNGITVNNLFGNFDRVVHTHSRMDTDPYGRPAIVFTHAGGVEGIAADLRRMLAGDFSRCLDTEYYRFHAPVTNGQSTATPQSRPVTPIDRPVPSANPAPENPSLRCTI